MTGEPILVEEEAQKPRMLIEPKPDANAPSEVGTTSIHIRVVYLDEPESFGDRPVVRQYNKDEWPYPPEDGY